ncbi:hypothetical protein RIR_jg33663.t1 [Rhizophagus irregularis DAOM 181602=DAOM 197198]|nr:hypothetical protein RIR_jg33663.t1 [Rhizophagus irregularis DAOM 181602=DAOM 197198]
MNRPNKIVYFDPFLNVDYHPIDVEQHQVYGPPGTVYRYAEYALIMQSISTPSPSPSPPPSNKRERD